MTSSTKPKEHNILQRSQGRTETGPYATCIKLFGEIYSYHKLCKRIDKQTDKQTNILITILCTPRRQSNCNNTFCKCWFRTFVIAVAMYLQAPKVGIHCVPHPRLGCTTHADDNAILVQPNLSNQRCANQWNSRLQCIIYLFFQGGITSVAHCRSS